MSRHSLNQEIMLEQYSSTG